MHQLFQIRYILLGGLSIPVSADAEPPGFPPGILSAFLAAVNLPVGPGPEGLAAGAAQADPGPAVCVSEVPAIGGQISDAEGRCPLICGL